MQVEIKSTPDTPDIGSLQKAADFINAFILGNALLYSSQSQDKPALSWPLVLNQYILDYQAKFNMCRL